MDEATFTQELSNLKQRMAQMTMGSSKSSSSAPNDQFREQLDDVKVHLTAMQTRLEAHLEAHRLQKSVTRSLDSMEDMSLFTPPSGHSGLLPPSGPLYWQLFNSLRADVRGIDKRVASLEQSVDDIEDRLDDVAPRHFTPASSDRGASQEPTDFFSTWNTSTTTPEPFGSRETGFPDGACADVTHSPHLISELADMQLVPLNMVPQMDAQVPSPTDRGSEGIAFREKEISQLEELLRGAHEKLKNSEDLNVQKDSEIEHLKTEQKRLEAKAKEDLAKLHHECKQKSNFLESLASRNQGVWRILAYRGEKLETANRTIVELRQRLQAGQTRWNDLTRTLGVAQREATRLRAVCEQKTAEIRRQQGLVAYNKNVLELKTDNYEKMCQQHNKDREEERRMHGHQINQFRAQAAAARKDAADDYNDMVEEHERDRDHQRRRHAHEVNHLRAQVTAARAGGVRWRSPRPASPRRQRGRHEAQSGRDDSPSRYGPTWESDRDGSESPWSNQAQRSSRSQRARHGARSDASPSRYCPTWDSDHDGSDPPWSNQAQSSNEGTAAEAHAMRRKNSLRLLERFAQADEYAVRRWSPPPQTPRWADIATQAARRVKSLADLPPPPLQDDGQSSRRRPVWTRETLHAPPTRSLQVYVEDESTGGDV